MRVGDRIMRKSNLEGGCILGARKQSSGVYMVCVAWDSTGTEQWLPSEEVRPWDKLQAPPVAKPTPWGRTTPAYLVALRRDLRINSGGRKQTGKTAEDQLADKLAKLSGRRKNRSRQKAKKLVAEYERSKMAPEKRFPMNKPAWNYAPNDAEIARREMKKLYQEKSGDHSY